MEKILQILSALQIIDKITTRMCILCVYHAVFHFVAYNKTSNKQPIFEREINNRGPETKRLCAYGSKGFRLWELSKSKDLQLQSNRFEQKIFEK